MMNHNNLLYDRQNDRQITGLLGVINGPTTMNYGRIGISIELRYILLHSMPT